MPVRTISVPEAGLRTSADSRKLPSLFCRLINPAVNASLSTPSAAAVMTVRAWS